MTFDTGLHEVCVRVGGQTGVRYVITKFSRMDSYPNFVTHGAPLSIRISAAVFTSVIVYPPTLQFVTISFFFKNARAYCTFYIYLAKPLSKVHVSNNRSNTDYDPQDIPLHSRMVNKIG